MTCGHPLAARAIECIGGLLRTYCWACRVEAEIRRNLHTNLR